MAPQTSVTTEHVAAFPGMPADDDFESESMIQGEASAEIPFGVFVGQGTDDSEFIKLAAITDKVVGVLIHHHGFQVDGELGTTGVKPDTPCTIMTRGRVWMTTEEAVTRGSGVLIRAIAGGAEVAGQVRDTADASDLIDASKWARFKSSGSSLVIVEFDVVNRGA